MYGFIRWGVSMSARFTSSADQQVIVGPLATDMLECLQKASELLARSAGGAGDDAGKLANRIQGLLRASREVSELVNTARDRPTGPVGRFPDREDVSCAALEEECTFESGRRALRDLAVTR